MVRRSLYRIAMLCNCTSRCDRSFFPGSFEDFIAGLENQSIAAGKRDDHICAGVLAMNVLCESNSIPS